jgi:hypothetical protein
MSGDEGTDFLFFVNGQSVYAPGARKQFHISVRTKIAIDDPPMRIPVSAALAKALMDCLRCGGFLAIKSGV